MTAVRWLARRTLTTALAAFAVLSIVYVAVTVAPKPEGGELVLNAPPTGREYVTWVQDLVSLDWGHSTILREPVTTLVWDGLRRSATYVLPAVLISTVIGAVLGLRTALGEHTSTDTATTVAAYLAFGVPNFVIGVVLLVTFARDSIGQIIHTGDPIQTVVWPAAVLTTTLTAAQIRYTRSEAAEYTHSELARLVRAVGGRKRDVARHVLRNAAVPLVSLFFTELLGVLLLNVYILESVFNIRGIGYLNFKGVVHGDVPLVVGTTFVFVLVGVGGSYLQDIAAAVLDPRLGTEHG